MASYHQTVDLTLLITNKPPQSPAWFKKWGGFYQEGAVLAVEDGVLETSLAIVYVNDDVVFPTLARMTTISKEVMFADVEEMTAYIFGHELGHHVWKKRNYEGTYHEQQAWCDSFALTLIAQALRWSLHSEAIKPAAPPKQMSLAIHLA